MPVLENPNHELFAQGLAKGKTQIEAYEAAGYSPDRGAACRLSANVNVQERVSELQEKAAKRVLVTVESLAEELDEAKGVAKGEKQSSAMVQAIMGKAKLFGLGSETRKLTGAITVVTITAEKLASLTDDELAALEAAYPVLEKLGLVGSNSASTTGEAG